MARRTFGEEVTGELVGKAIIWGPSIAGALLAGPLGLLVGAAVAVAIVTSGSDSSRAPSSADQNPSVRE